MTSIWKIIRVNVKNIIYGKGLDDLLPRAVKTPQPEDYILTHVAVYMQSKINYGEESYYSNSIRMDSDSGAIGIDRICTDYISHTTEEFLDNWLNPRAV